jgi:hypothetical protein
MMNQAANDKPSSYDGVANLLESVEHFLNRLGIYTRIPSTPTIDEMVVNILAELLSMLALAVKEIRHGLSSEFIISNTLSYSAQHSQIRTETFRREGYRSGPAKAGPTHAGRSSDYRSSDSRGRLPSRSEYERGHGRQENCSACNPLVTNTLLDGKASVDGIREALGMSC